MDTLDLLLNGYSLQYTPEEVARVTDVIPAPEPVLQPTPQDLSDKLSEYATQLASLSIAVETPQYVLDPQTYVALAHGAPTFDEMAKLRAFEAHHLSDEGDLNAFVAINALSLSALAQTASQDPALADLTTQLPTTDLADPATKLREYYTLRDASLSDAIESLQLSASDITGDVNFFDALCDLDPIYRTFRVQDISTQLVGSDDPLTQIIASADNMNQPMPVPSATRDPLAETLGLDTAGLSVQLQKTRNYLQLLRDLLSMGKLLLLIDIGRLEDGIMAQIHDRPYALLNGIKVRALSAFYQQTLYPMVEKIRMSDANTQTTLPVLSHLHDLAFSALAQKLLLFQHELAGLAAEDQSRYQKHVKANAALLKGKQIQAYIKFLDAMMAKCDAVLMERDPYAALMSSLDTQMWPKTQPQKAPVIVVTPPSSPTSAYPGAKLPGVTP